MASPELDNLIVRHLADLDRTTQRLLRLQADVFEALRETTEDWCEKNGWFSKFRLDDAQWPDECWLAPMHWHTPDSNKDEAFDARIHLGVGYGDAEDWIEGEDFWFLTRLCGIGVGHTLFRFETELKQGRKWKQFFPRMTDLVRDTAFVSDLTPSFVLPVRLDADALAHAILEENLQLALTPYVDALEALKRAEPVFTQCVQMLRDEAQASILPAG